jgi:hypothetical protein
MICNQDTILKDRLLADLPTLIRNSQSSIPSLQPNGLGLLEYNWLQLVSLALHWEAQLLTIWEQWNTTGME